MNDLAPRHREWRNQRCVVGQAHAGWHESDGHGELAELWNSSDNRPMDRKVRTMKYGPTAANRDTPSTQS